MYAVESASSRHSCRPLRFVAVRLQIVCGPMNAAARGMVRQRVVTGRLGMVLVWCCY